MTIPAQFDRLLKINGMRTGWKIIYHSEPDHRTPYTIVIPPLMLQGFAYGHMLNTIKMF
jgi:valyl-tRNA synthetase